VFIIVVSPFTGTQWSTRCYENWAIKAGNFLQKCVVESKVAMKYLDRRYPTKNSKYLDKRLYAWNTTLGDLNE
jgi:hypothetical protein